MNKPIFFSHQQDGMVLVIGLIFLVMLTIIGITAMSSTAMTEKLTQNLRESSTAFEAAESGLGNGESWIQAQSPLPTALSTCTTTPCYVWKKDALGSFYQQSLSWWQSNGIAFSGNLANVVTQPYYIIEQYGFVPYDLSPDTLSQGRGYYYYRITSRGTGSTATSQAVIQSIFTTQLY